MTIRMTLLAMALAAGVLAGCGGGEPAETTTATTGAAPAATQPVVATGQPLGSVKVGDQAVCAICAKGGHTAEPEEAKAVLDYKGKTYAFCNEGEKAEFISNPAKYADAGK